VLHATTDQSGYDVVVEAHGVLRHIQLKSSHATARTASINAHTALSKKPDGCIIWLFFDARTLAFERFLWFGGAPGSGLPDLGERVARHTKADSAGQKHRRPALRVITKGRFEKLADMAELTDRLFGPAA